MIEEGSVVFYYDQYGKGHNALVTAVHGKFWESSFWTEEEAKDFYPQLPLENLQNLIGQEHSIPSINLIYVESDAAKTDSYGRQIARETSVVHKNNQSAHGRFYTFIEPMEEK